MRDSLFLIESTHVLGLALVFGTIVVIHFRLLGIASIRRPIRRLESDILKWTWAAISTAISPPRSPRHRAKSAAKRVDYYWEVLASRVSLWDATISLAATRPSS